MKADRERRESGVPWIGDLPRHWPVVPAKAILNERRSRSSRDDIHLTPSQTFGVIPQTEYMERTGNKVVLNLTGSDEMRHVEPDDFISHLRSFQGGFERALSSGKVSAAYTVLTLRPIADADFFGFLFKSSAYIQALQTTTDQLRDGQSIRFGQVCLLPVPLPDLAEQVLIANFLQRETTQIDDFISEQERLEALLVERRAATIVRAVTVGVDGQSAMRPSGVEWIGDLPAEWSVVRARFLCEVSTGSGDSVDAVANGRFPFYVRSERPLRSDHYEFEEEAVLTAGDGAGVGKVFHLVSGRFAAHQRVYVLRRFRGIEAKYFYYYFAAMFGKVALDGSAKSTVDSVRRQMITDLPVVVPPLQQQRDIVEYLDVELTRLDAAIADARQAIALSRERRAALISAAVTGKIDVRDH